MKEIQRFTGDLNNNLVDSRELHGGVQHIFRFENNMGASVVHHQNSVGFIEDAEGESKYWELAVLNFNLGGDFIEKGSIVQYIDYSTKITSNTIGWMTARNVASTLRRIKRLKNNH